MQKSRSQDGSDLFLQGLSTFWNNYKQGNCICKEQNDTNENGHMFYCVILDHMKYYTRHIIALLSLTEL